MGKNPRVSAVNGPISINGGLDSDHDILILDDTGDTRNHNQPLASDVDGNFPQDSEGVLSDTQIRGLGLWQGIDYTDLEIIDVRLGQGNDIFTVYGLLDQF